MRQYFIILLNQYTYQNRISEFHNKYIKDNLFLDLNNWDWETVFTCLYPFTVQTRPLAGTASGMASDSVRSRGKALLGPIWNLRPMGGRDFTEF